MIGASSFTLKMTDLLVRFPRHSDDSSMRTLNEVLASVLIGVRILVLALLSVARCSEEKDFFLTKSPRAVARNTVFCSGGPNSVDSYRIC
jgi:hypothetical protein